MKYRYEMKRYRVTITHTFYLKPGFPLHPYITNVKIVVFSLSSYMWQHTISHSPDTHLHINPCYLLELRSLVSLYDNRKSLQKIKGNVSLFI